MQSLSGKLAIVTGVGRGIALALARRGARVALLGRTAGKLQAVVDEIGALGAAATPDRLAPSIALSCDVKNGPSVRKAVETAVAHLGGVDILDVMTLAGKAARPNLCGLSIRGLRG